MVRHTAHIAVYQSLSVRAVASRYVPSSAADIADNCPLNSVVIALEVENVNTVGDVFCSYCYFSVSMAACPSVFECLIFFFVVSCGVTY